MLARDLAEPYPALSLDDHAFAAARLIARESLPGLLVTDHAGSLKAILTVSHLVRVIVPDYILEDEALAAVIDEAHADRLCRVLADLTVRDCLPRPTPPPAALHGDAMAMEIAALMALTGSPLVAVTETPPTAPRAPERLLGAVTTTSLLRRLLDQP